MNNQRHIDNALTHYRLGNKQAAIQLLEAGIRSAMSTRTANQYKKALNTIKGA
jgi:hypothetical protein